jgi:hypothetical protein
MDLAKITATVAAQHESSPLVGRILQADADFFCYQCAHPDEPFTQNFEQIKKKIEYSRKLARASAVNVFVTLGLKGGRHQIATVKPYQDDRGKSRSPEMTQRVRELRTALATYTAHNIQPIVCTKEEADDVICRMQGNQIALHGIDSSVVMSDDKDLWMVQGLHCDSTTGQMRKATGYGVTMYKDVGNKEPKLVGLGTSWFWHQMIMGDGADTIPGLPFLSARLANRYLPLKTSNPNRKPLACGEAKAVEILRDVNNDAEAFKRVYEAYRDWYTDQTDDMFFEQAYLLWLRRTNKLLDCLEFLRPLGFKYELLPQRKEQLQRFVELVKLQEAQNVVS